MKTKRIKKQLRIALITFMVLLILSGATAIPVEEQLQWFFRTFQNTDSRLSQLFKIVFTAVTETRSKYPFLFYGYDWLAFAHFVIAVAFIGPLKDPVKNIWVLEFGLIACAMVIPYALLFSAYRHLPFWWSLIDCAFGVFGFIPLWYCRQKAKQLEEIYKQENLNVVF